MSADPGSFDLRQIDTWLFDLDGTLYPLECGFLGQMERKMTAEVARLLGLDLAAAYAVQKTYLAEHGTTLSGLMIHHGVEPQAFMDAVHDVPLDCVPQDPRLRQGLERLPGRRLVFTNADERHALRVLERLEIGDLFDDVFHIALSGYVPKPRPETFAAVSARHAIEPALTCFFEDSPRNLEPAARLGMTTVLVGPNALESQAAFVHHRATDLPDFLLAAQVKETTAP